MLIYKNRNSIFIDLKRKKVNLIHIINESKKNFFFCLNKQTYNFTFIKELKKFFYKSKKVSILDICINLDHMIPHYCYHFNLSIAGNCRMCLVELSTVFKPIVSCAFIVAPKLRIYTNTKLVTKAREGIAEFLLVNHPLDCPICDQGGECDLQDQSVAYGSHRGRFFHIKDSKRSVTEVMCNNFVQLNLTRCIHCTRCVRFLNEIGGNTSFGMLGRGRNSEISLYTKNILISELGSNITEYCPVGALTIKYYALEERPWAEIYLETIDLSDSLSVPILIGTTGLRTSKILPQYNTDLDISWITERTRFLLDGLKVQQFYYPMKRILKKYNFTGLINNLSNSLLVASSWKTISYNLFINLKKKRNFFLSYSIGELLDLETILFIKESSLFYGSNNLKSKFEQKKIQNTDIINEDFDSNYILNYNNYNNYHSIFFVNLNLRIENPILNAKIRQKVVWDRAMKIFFFGSKYNLTYKYIHLGCSTRNLLSIIEGGCFFFNFLKKKQPDNKKKFLLFYSSVLNSYYKNEFFKALFQKIISLNKFFELNYLAKSAASIGSLDLSFSRFIKKEKNLCNLKKNFFSEGIHFYIDYNDYKKNNLIKEKKKLAHKTFIYQNSQGDNYALFMDYFLPTYSYLEKDLGFYTNCFGILRKTRQVLLPRNLFAQDNIDIILLIQKILFKNNNLFTKINIVVKLNSYLPLKLFMSRRHKTYLFFEKQIKYTLIHFYIISNKKKNSYKNSFFLLNSVNINLLSDIHYNSKSNLTI